MASCIRMLFEMHTALGSPVVPEEFRMATVWSPPDLSGSGLYGVTLSISLSHCHRHKFYSLIKHFSCRGIQQVLYFGNTLNRIGKCEDFRMPTKGSRVYLLIIQTITEYKRWLGNLKDILNCSYKFKTLFR